MLLITLFIIKLLARINIYNKGFCFTQQTESREKQISHDRLLLDQKQIVGSVGPTTPTTTERHAIAAVTPNVSSYIGVI